eukprot:TRINITY_DN60955_c0_g1_i1.p1 TRINITY_DN60955_c0_g1~~TRINITY_DN60955_c0_g1_i1.p1  ORF type:complete len:304 (+),score=122.02 TRINITY_DN60955_c0_g1_i1:62-913(+)
MAAAADGPRTPGAAWCVPASEGDDADWRQPPPLPRGLLPSSWPPVQGRCRLLPGDHVEVRDQLRQAPDAAAGDEEEWIPGVVTATHPLAVRTQPGGQSYGWDEVRELPSSELVAAEGEGDHPHAELLWLRDRSAGRAARGDITLRLAQLLGEELRARQGTVRDEERAAASLRKELDAQYVAACDWHGMRRIPPTETPSEELHELREQLRYWEHVSAALAPPPPPAPPKKDLLQQLREELEEQEAEQLEEEERQRERQLHQELAAQRRRSSMRLLADIGSMRQR